MLMPNTKPSVLSVRGLTKSYGNDIHALRGIDIDVKEGEFLVIPRYAEYRTLAVKAAVVVAVPEIKAP